MIFQEPMRALNPLLRIENQIREVLRRHALCRRREERARVQQLLREVGLDDVARVARCYPFQLSGGMQQRVMIAMALAGEPQLLIADEPTTALDVCVQAGILDLLQRLQRERGLAILLVSHDLSVVADRSDAIAVMYAGQLVEKAPAASLMAEPVHPYTRGLLASVARMDTAPGSLRGIEGAPPDLRHLPPGCAFAPRCPNAEAHCLQEEPSLQKVSDDSKTMLVNRLVRCPVALQSCVSGGNDVA
jgi:oligopeptide/dipeptide ABC transporter ATP-binding protein